MNIKYLETLCGKSEVGHIFVEDDIEYTNNKGIFCHMCGRIDKKRELNKGGK